MLFAVTRPIDVNPPALHTNPWRFARAGAAVKALAIFVAVLCCSGTLDAQESGQLPYAAIHKVVSRAQKVKHPRLRAVVTLESTAKGAKAKEITLVIQAKSGPINVPVGPNGEIRNFPITPELLKENPPVLSNQPKGTSRLQVGLEAIVPDGLTYSYRELAQLLDDANAEMKKQAGMLSIMLPRAKALSFQFRGGGKETVTIKRNEPQVLTADANGVVRVEVDKAVAAQDPQVVVSEKPVKVLVN